MKKVFCLLLFASLLYDGFCQQFVQKDPIYLRTDTCWKGFFPHKDQYVEYLLPGSSKLQDAYHVMVNPDLGLMIAFADKANFENNVPLLEAHKKWEVDYWKKQVPDVKVVDCKELYKGLTNILVTGMEVTSGNPAKTIINCFIAVSGKDGVYVFNFSGPNKTDQELVKRFIRSIKVIDKPLSPNNITDEAKELQNKNNGTNR
jgi:hypothetical protein